MSSLLLIFVTITVGSSGVVVVVVVVLLSTGSPDRTVKCVTFISPKLFGLLIFYFLFQLG